MSFMRIFHSGLRLRLVELQSWKLECKRVEGCRNPGSDSFGCSVRFGCSVLSLFKGGGSIAVAWSWGQGLYGFLD